MTQFSTRRLTMNAALIAIYIVLEYFSVYIGNYIKLSFYAFPMLVAAMLFGTADGLFVAGIGEFLYQMLHYGFSATTLLWIVPPMVHALIAGVMTQKMRDSLSMGKVGLTVIVSGIVSTILTTFVVQLVNWYKPEDDQLIVAYDDVDLPEGKIRFRPSGSAGTHNGMRNIIYLLGRENFPRVRVGIGRPPEGWDMKDWVLASYQTKELRQTMFDAYCGAADVIAELIERGVEPARQLVSKLNG